MKTWFVILLWTVCLACGSRQTFLSGHIENYHGEQVSIAPMGNDELEDTLQVDASGNFIYVPENKMLQKYVLRIDGFAPYSNLIYLGEGDRVEVNFILSGDKTMEVQFADDRAAENEYLRAFDAFQNSGMSYAPEMKALSFSAYQAKFNEKERELQALLDKVADSDLKKQLAREQHLAFQNCCLDYGYILSSRSEQGGEASDSDFTAFVNSIDVNNPDECNQYMMWAIITWYQDNDPEYKKENWELDYLERLDRLVSNPVQKNAFATYRAEAAISASLGKSLEKVMACYNRICTDDSMRQRVNEQYQEYVRVYSNLMPGKVAPDFELISDKGETVRLSDLYGQYLFIDVWATWCGGCVMEIPYMEKLQAHFADDKRIKLISISWDYTREVWLDYLKKHPANWAQYIVDKENMDFMKKEYRMTFIPRFLLLDPEGRIISIDYARPSSPECIEMLEQDMKK